MTDPNPYDQIGTPLPTVPPLPAATPAKITSTAGITPDSTTDSPVTAILNSCTQPRTPITALITCAMFEEAKHFLAIGQQLYGGTLISPGPSQKSGTDLASYSGLHSDLDPDSKSNQEAPELNPELFFGTIPAWIRTLCPQDADNNYPNHKCANNNTVADTFVIAQVGIGLAACASSLGTLLAYLQPRIVVNIGIGGGLDNQAQIGEVIAGTSYIFAGASCQIWGYDPGQLPGQPATFSTPDNLVKIAQSLGARPGQIVSSDAFVTKQEAGNLQERFPNISLTDMESAALALVSTTWGLDFIALRGVSDLCHKPNFDADSYQNEDAPNAADNAAKLGWELLKQLPNCPASND